MSKFETDKLNECQCGFKPTYYSVWYGRTPYDIWCPDCKKQTTWAKCKVTGGPQNLFDYWNTHISKLTLEEMENEVSDFRKEHFNNLMEHDYKRYIYYWVKGEGEKLVASY